MKTDAKGQRAICIAGAHRSGTSMVTRLLHCCGLELGPESELMPAQADNPEGFWEHLHLVVPISFVIGIAFYLFEVVIVVTIQAFIFAALTAIYIGSAIEPAH